jgi:hypothetical protein
LFIGDIWVDKTILSKTPVGRTDNRMICGELKGIILPDNLIEVAAWSKNEQAPEESDSPMRGLYFKMDRILLSISIMKIEEEVVTKSSVIGEIFAHPIYPKNNQTSRVGEKIEDILFATRDTRGLKSEEC